ncbi:MAG: hypothetical protein AB7T48_04735 [Solirubrobacterales bacterium]
MARSAALEPQPRIHGRASSTAAANPSAASAAGAGRRPRRSARPSSTAAAASAAAISSGPPKVTPRARAIRTGLGRRSSMRAMLGP